MKKKKLDFKKLQSLNDELYHGEKKLSGDDLKPLLGGSHEPTCSSGVADDSPSKTYYA